MSLASNDSHPHAMARQKVCCLHTFFCNRVQQFLAILQMQEDGDGQLADDLLSSNSALPPLMRSATFSSGAAAQRAVNGAASRPRAATVSGGLLRAGASGSCGGLTAGLGDPKPTRNGSSSSLGSCSAAAQAAHGALARAQQRVTAASMPAEAAASPANVRRSISNSPRQHSSAATVPAVAAVSGSLVTQSMPMCALEGAPGMTLPSPDGSSEFTGADFAALLASGTAGIR